MPNGETVTGFPLLNTSNCFPALQFVGLLVVTQSVDEEAQVVHVLDAVGDHHVLMDKVGLRQVGPGLNVNKELQQVFGRHNDGSVQRNHVALVQVKVQISSEFLVEVVHNVGRIAVRKLWYRHTDEFHCVFLKDLNVLFNCLVASSWGIRRRLVQDDVIFDVL